MLDTVLAKSVERYPRNKLKRLKWNIDPRGGNHEGAILNVRRRWLNISSKSVLHADVQIKWVSCVYYTLIIHEVFYRYLRSRVCSVPFDWKIPITWKFNQINYVKHRGDWTRIKITTSTPSTRLFFDNIVHCRTAPFPITINFDNVLYAPSKFHFKIRTLYDSTW